MRRPFRLRQLFRWCHFRCCSRLNTIKVDDVAGRVPRILFIRGELGEVRIGAAELETASGHGCDVKLTNTNNANQKDAALPCAFVNLESK